jgi:hypothetical protein
LGASPKAAAEPRAALLEKRFPAPHPIPATKAGFFSVLDVPY